MASFDEKVNERYKRHRQAFSEIDDMSEDMLRTYCTICVQIDELNEQIKKEGYIVKDERGKLRENIAVNTVHKLNADKARYFAPLKRALTKQIDSEVEDDLDSFLEL